MAVAKKVISFGDFSWEIEVRDRIDVEYVVEDLSKTSAFYIMLNEPYRRPRISKEIKDALLKNNINV